jgi:hypothetical protein
LHDDWNVLLDKYVKIDEKSAVNLFDYISLSQNLKDQNLLHSYLSQLEGVDPNLLSRKATIAFYANLYNAITVMLISENYPIKSILKLGPLNSGPWKRKLIKINGELVSLDDIEHNILRTQYSSPYLHYMLNCASISCPNLQKKAWEGRTLELDQLRAADEYINSSRGVILQKKGLKVSSIYKWFKEDFQRDGGVLDHILKHASEDLKTAIINGVKIRAYNYDWTLNDVTG